MPELSDDTYARCQVPQEVDFDSLIDSPTRLQAAVSSDKTEDGTALNSLFDYHAVYRIPVDQFATVLLDHPAQAGRDESVAKSDVLCRTRLDDGWYEQVRLGLEFSALGIKRTYTYVIDMKSLWKSGRDEFCMGWELRESLDSKFQHVQGSWYLSSIEIDGTPHTYARYYASSTEVDPPPGTALAIRLFADRDMRQRMNGAYQAAAERAANR